MIKLAKRVKQPTLSKKPGSMGEPVPISDKQKALEPMYGFIVMYETFIDGNLKWTFNELMPYCESNDYKEVSCKNPIPKDRNLDSKLIILIIIELYFRGYSKYLLVLPRELVKFRKYFRNDFKNMSKKKIISSFRELSKLINYEVKFIKE